MHRRTFLRLTGAAPLAAASRRSQGTPRLEAPSTREGWVSRLDRLAGPVLSHLASGTLRASMPVEEQEGADRGGVTHLEAAGRLLAGLAPWLELDPAPAAERDAQARYRRLAIEGLARGVDSTSADALNFTRGGQPLVDAAFLGQALLRAPRHLAGALDGSTRMRLVAALESTRAITPGFSNWLLFSAMIEAALKALEAPWDRVRVDYALRQHDQWYKGDGVYGDGPAFHWDYYNSYVIQPMLVDVLAASADESPAWKDLESRVEARARRYAAILARGAERGHRPNARCGRDVRRRRVAADWPGWPPARPGRALHLHRQPLPRLRGVPAPGTAARRPVLERRGDRLDGPAHLGRRGCSHRPRHRRLGRSFAPALIPERT